MSEPTPDVRAPLARFSRRTRVLVAVVVVAAVVAAVTAGVLVRSRPSDGVRPGVLYERAEAGRDYAYTLTFQLPSGTLTVRTGSPTHSSDGRRSGADAVFVPVTWTLAGPAPADAYAGTAPDLQFDVGLVADDHVYDLRAGRVGSSCALFDRDQRARLATSGFTCELSPVRLLPWAPRLGWVGTTPAGSAWAVVDLRLKANSYVSTRRGVTPRRVWDTSRGPVRMTVDGASAASVLATTDTDGQFLATYVFRVREAPAALTVTARFVARPAPGVAAAPFTFGPSAALRLA